MRAEARFLRAFSYWHGIDLWGNIPLVTEDFVIGATPPEQSDRATIYQYVVDELNDIRGDLPAAGAAEYGRVDQGAVAMLLAKLYLNAEVYIGADQSSLALTRSRAGDRRRVFAGAQLPAQLHGRQPAIRRRSSGRWRRTATRPGRGAA